MVPAWVQALSATPRRWAKLGNGLKALEMRFNPAMNPLYDAIGLTRPPWGMSGWNIEDTFAWSGGCKHPTAPIFYRPLGGGHGDSAYNGIFRLDLLSGPDFYHHQWGDGTIGHWDGSDQLGFDARDGTYDDYASTGNPRSAHTYNGPTCTPDGTIYCTQGYKAGAGGLNGHTLWAYRTNGTWAAVSTLPAGGATFRDMCHVPSLGGPKGVLVGIGQGNAGIDRYNIDANTWVSSGTFTNTSDGARMVYVPAPWDCVVGLNYMVGNGFFVHDFGRTSLTGGNEHRPGSTGTRPFTVVGDDLKTGVWVPALGCIVGWKWGANLWTLTPNADGNCLSDWAWGEIAADPGNTVVPVGRIGHQSQSVYGGFFHHDFSGVQVFGLSIIENSGNAALQPYFMVH